MRIEQVVDAAAVRLAADLFDAPPLAAATERFLADPTHHLLFAYDEAGRAAWPRSPGCRAWRPS
jgi:aminoglycoside 3-N-acetyltransferase I